MSLVVRFPYLKEQNFKFFLFIASALGVRDKKYFSESLDERMGVAIFALPKTKQRLKRFFSPRSVVVGKAEKLAKKIKKSSVGFAELMIVC